MELRGERSRNATSFILQTAGKNIPPSLANSNYRVDGYSHDAAGNLMNDEEHQYTYDAENRLIKVDNGTTGTYTANHARPPRGPSNLSKATTPPSLRSSRDEELVTGTPLESTLTKP